MGRRDGSWNIAAVSGGAILSQKTRTVVTVLPDSRDNRDSPS